MAVPCSFIFSVLLLIQNPLSWLPWHTIAMSPSVTLYCIQLWCLGASVYGWLPCPTLEVTWVPWFTHPLPLFWSTVIKMSLIIFSVTSLPCLSYLAQTPRLMNGFSPLTAAQWKSSASSSSSSPTFSSSAQSWGSALPAGGRKPSPHVPLTWLLWPSIRGLFSSFTHGPAICILPTLIKLSPCSTPLSSQCWTHWFIVWEIKM